MMKRLILMSIVLLSFNTIFGQDSEKNPFRKNVVKTDVLIPILYLFDNDNYLQTQSFQFAYERFISKRLSIEVEAVGFNSDTEFGYNHHIGGHKYQPNRDYGQKTISKSYLVDVDTKWYIFPNKYNGGFYLGAGIFAGKSKNSLVIKDYKTDGNQYKETYDSKVLHYGLIASIGYQLFLLNDRLVIDAQITEFIKWKKVTAESYYVSDPNYGNSDNYSFYFDPSKVAIMVGYAF